MLGFAAALTRAPVPVTMKNVSWRNRAAWVLAFLGLFNLASHLSGVRVLGAVGQFIVAAPLPIAFTDRGGFEDFALQVSIEGLTVDGKEFRKRITREDYARLSGPFARRTVYLAVFTYRPNLPRRIADPVLNYGPCRTDVLQKAFSLPGAIQELSLDITTRTRGRTRYWRYSIDCR